MTTDLIPGSLAAYEKAIALLVEFVNDVAIVGPDQVRDVARLTDSFDEEPGWPDLHTTYQKAEIFLSKLEVPHNEPDRNDDPDDEDEDDADG